MTAELTTMAAALDAVRLAAESMRDETLRYLVILGPQALMRGAGILAVVVGIAVRRARRGTPADITTSQAA